MLRDAQENCTVVDRKRVEGVDVVGNILETTALERAKVREASAVILALEDDAEAVFATAVVRDHAPEVPLIVAVSRSRNVERLYRAGADFAFSQGQLAGQILAYQLLGEQAVPVESRLKFVRLGTGGLSGWHPWRGEVVERTGAKVIAVERAGEVFVEFPDDFQMTPDDVLIVCGTLESIERFQQEFQSLPLAARQGRRQP